MGQSERAETLMVGGTQVDEWDVLCKEGDIILSWKKTFGILIIYYEAHDA